MDSFEIIAREGGFDLAFMGTVRIAHRAGAPFLSAGRGEGMFGMHRGNFRIRERLEELVALRDWRIVESGADRARVLFSRGGLYPVEVSFRASGAVLELAFAPGEAGEAGAAPNRLRIALPAEAPEHVYGCGEQFSHFALRGRNFPLWTSEQGVGRNKLTEITRLADADDGAGGDYWWTFFPQASFVSSAGYWCHLDTDAYAEFDFRAPDRHELYAWDLPRRLVLGSAEARAGRGPSDTMRDLVASQSAHFGRQRVLPDWAYDGVVLGIQGGTKACLDKLAAARARGVRVAGIWAQDWEGINMTSFGQRLRWNWIWDRERYPGLDATVKALKAEGVRFLGYINPYVGADMSLYREAEARGFLARRRIPGSEALEDYRVEFGEFYAGIVDLTNPLAFAWYKDVIKRELVAFGLSGWMADFGEYLPTDAVLHDGRPAEIAHNAWPALWARCNREAVDEAVAEGLAGEGEIVYFMRAGGPGSQRDCPLMWAGDQNVDWSEDDGLPSVIPAALSLAMSGHGLHHSDLGGYTTLYGMKRTKELFMRWAEQSALTVLMRSHEGNRPKDNWQFDSDGGTLGHLARMTAFHAALKPYLKELVRVNAEEGLPVLRPLFLHDGGDAEAWTIKDEYLLGPDLLCAPVLAEGAVSRKVHLPAGTWIHLWSGVAHRVGPGPTGADVVVEAPLGEPPAFARAGSPWLAVFEDAVRAAGRPQQATLLA